MKKMLIINLAAFALLAGCNQSKTDPTEAFFADEGSSSRLKALLDAEAQRGAAADATLYDAHFTGMTLNALGLAKLDAIVGSAHAPLTVYVDAAGPVAMARQRAVADYLRNGGNALYEYHVEIGVDPRSTHPVADDLARMPKTESGTSKESAAGAPAGSPPNPGDSMPPLPGLGSPPRK